jgi:ferritin-like metal-binding protein YciE
MAQPTLDQFTSWLNDAHAMESGLISILEAHASQFGNTMPHAADRMRRHITETQQHAQRIEECLRFLGTQPSTVKSGLSSLIGALEGSSTALFSDQLVKDALADYASEQFEVACYTALVRVAEELGYPEIAQRCRQNLNEDKAMADWLLQQVPLVATRAA